MHAWQCFATSLHSRHGVAWHTHTRADTRICAFVFLRRGDNTSQAHQRCLSRYSTNVAWWPRHEHRGSLANRMLAGRQSKHKLVDARPDGGRHILTRCSGLSALRVMCCAASGRSWGIWCNRCFAIVNLRGLSRPRSVGRLIVFSVGVLCAGYILAVAPDSRARWGCIAFVGVGGPRCVAYRLCTCFANVVLR